jgi:hypothetical protein
LLAVGLLARRRRALLADKSAGQMSAGVWSVLLNVKLENQPYSAGFSSASYHSPRRKRANRSICCGLRDFS